MKIVSKEDEGILIDEILFSIRIHTWVIVVRLGCSPDQTFSLSLLILVDSPIKSIAPSGGLTLMELVLNGVCLSSLRSLGTSGTIF